MSIKVICDRCGDNTGTLDDSAWRVITVDLEYLPDTREHGTCDKLFEITLCHQCVDLVTDPKGPDLMVAMLEAMES